MRKPKAWLGFELMSDRKGNKRNFCKCIGSKRKINTNADPLLNVMGNLMMKNVEKKDWLSVYFALVLTHKFCFQASCISVAV